MLYKLTYAHLCRLALLLLAACHSSTLAETFFEGPSNEVERMRDYSIEDQYVIFRYGNDVIHPPMLELADPIAERGAAVIPFLVEKMDQDPDRVAALGDTLEIFRRMQVLGFYDVRSDQALIGELATRVREIESETARRSLQQMLTRISND